LLMAENQFIVLFGLLKAIQSYIVKISHFTLFRLYLETSNFHGKLMMVLFYKLIGIQQIASSFLVVKTVSTVSGINMDVNFTQVFLMTMLLQV
jgi:hypothetical protein